MHICETGRGRCSRVKCMIATMSAVVRNFGGQDYYHPVSYIALLICSIEIATSPYVCINRNKSNRNEVCPRLTSHMGTKANPKLDVILQPHGLCWQEMIFIVFFFKKIFFSFQVNQLSTDMR